MTRLHIDGVLCVNPVCGRTHIPPVLEPDCPRCKKGALVEMTSYPDAYAKCTVYLACESCDYQRPVGFDGIL